MLRESDDVLEQSSEKPFCFRNFELITGFLCGSVIVMLDMKKVISRIKWDSSAEIGLYRYLNLITSLSITGSC